MRHVNPTFKFGKQEVADLLRAWILTSIAFAVFFIRVGYISTDVVSFGMIFVIAGLTAGIGFIVHELCHKIAAHFFKVYGEFRANTTMLIVSIAFAFMGFLFAAPGAVMIFDRVTKKENGIISAAGPVSNMVLTILFVPLLFFPGIIGIIGVFGVLINAILGAFNMIPFLGLDGAKIFAWSKPVYFSLVCIAGVLVVGAHIIT